MFFLEPFFLKIAIILCGFLVAVGGLTFFALRRREEILEDYLAPNDEHLEDDFFRRFLERKKVEEILKKQLEEGENGDSTPEVDPDEGQWGDM